MGGSIEAHGGWPIKWLKYPGEDVTMPGVASTHRSTRENLLVYCEPIGAARSKSLTGYPAVAQIMGLRSTGHQMGRETGQMLDKISQNEFSQGRPLLSAVVVGHRGIPGPGFFKLARKLGKLQSESREEERRFWPDEKAAVYAEWEREFE